MERKGQGNGNRQLQQAEEGQPGRTMDLMVLKTIATRRKVCLKFLLMIERFER